MSRSSLHGHGGGALGSWSRKEFDRWQGKYERRRDFHQLHQIEKEAHKAQQKYRDFLHAYTAGKQFPTHETQSKPRFIQKQEKQPEVYQQSSLPVPKQTGHHKPVGPSGYEALSAPILDDEITTLDGPVVIGGTRTNPARRRIRESLGRRVQAVLFDVYDVLFSTPGRPVFLPAHFRQALEHVGLSKDGYGDHRIVQAGIQAQRMLRAMYAGQYFQTGSEEPPPRVWLEHHAMVMKELGVEHDGLAWEMERVLTGSQVLGVLDTEALEMLRVLQGGGYRLGVLCNSVKSHRPRMEREGVLSFFDARQVLFSFETGHWKPDVAAFGHACSTLGLEPDEVAYVGARLDGDVSVAAKMGMYTVRVVRGRQPLRGAVGGIAVSHLKGLLHAFPPLAGVRDGVS